MGPIRMNTTDSVMHSELAVLPHLIDSDAESRVGMTIGAGEAFSAGGDYETVVAEAGNYGRTVCPAVTKQIDQLVARSNGGA